MLEKERKKEILEGDGDLTIGLVFDLFFLGFFII